MKNRNVSSTILLALGFLALSPIAQAVVPVPDGGYPNFNTAKGQNALKNLSTGQGNTAVGWFSLFSDTAGSFNTGVGAGALALNTADANTATGTVALFLNTTGTNNTADGAFALLHNSEGSDNTATGFQALFNNTIGGGNTASGEFALLSNITGSTNTANGLAALEFNMAGDDNTAIGHNALFSNTTGVHNIALGFSAGVGTTGNYNVDIGHPGFAGEDGTIRIGINGNQTRAFIAGIRGVTTANAAIPVLIDTLAQLGTTSSSRRFKKEIKAMDSASEAILALKPVTFHYKTNNTGTAQFGLIAEEVAEVNPDLVVCDDKGEIYIVRYDAVNAMLLNEFLKEHKKVEEQQATIAQLKCDGAKGEASVAELDSRVAKQEVSIAEQQKAMETLTAQLKEQAAQIQKVSAQVEMSKPAPQLARNRTD